MFFIRFLRNYYSEHVIVQHVVLLFFQLHFKCNQDCRNIAISGTFQNMTVQGGCRKKSEQHARGNGSHTFDSLILDMHVIID